MNIEVITATNPRHLVGDQDSITLDVWFSHLEEPVEFTARRDDAEQHGRELYSRAVFGEFGDIAVLSPPPLTEAEQQSRLNEALKQAATIMAPLEDADKLGIISESEKVKLKAWQLYRVALYRLPQSEGWPSEIILPDVPST